MRLGGSGGNRYTKPVAVRPAADCILRHLERRRDGGLPLIPGAVDLASRLLEYKANRPFPAPLRLPPFSNALVHVCSFARRPVYRWPASSLSLGNHSS